MSNNTRNEVSQLALEIEVLAHQVQELIQDNEPILVVANELARKSNTFVFSLGEMYAIDKMASSKKIRNKTTASGQPRNFHNLRDAATGRFISKI